MLPIRALSSFGLLHSSQCFHGSRVTIARRSPRSFGIWSGPGVLSPAGLTRSYHKGTTRRGIRDLHDLPRGQHDEGERDLRVDRDLNRISWDGVRYVHHVLHPDPHDPEGHNTSVVRPSREISRVVSTSPRVTRIRMLWIFESCAKVLCAIS